jgi:dTDP-4-dehydrorhamnose 3,5-epimerase/WD40-like Beta Propeller Repeat
LAGTEGAGSPFFSPDGEWIAFPSDRKIKKISVRGGAAVTLCDAPSRITLYNPAGEGTIRWNDPAIGIEWPGLNPVLSQKDSNAGTLADWLNSPQSEIFRFSPAV